MSKIIEINTPVTGTARFQAAVQLTCALLISQRGKRKPTGDIADSVGAALDVVESFHEQLHSFDLEARITNRASTETH